MTGMWRTYYSLAVTMNTSMGAHARLKMLRRFTTGVYTSTAPLGRRPRGGSEIGPYVANQEPQMRS